MILLLEVIVNLLILGSRIWQISQEIISLWQAQIF